MESGAVTEDLAAKITRRYQELLDDTTLTPTQLTAALSSAVKWWASTNQPAAPSGPPPGSGFNEGAEDA